MTFTSFRTLSLCASKGCFDTLVAASTNLALSATCSIITKLPMPMSRALASDARALEVCAALDTVPNFSGALLALSYPYTKLLAQRLLSVKSDVRSQFAFSS